MGPIRLGIVGVGKIARDHHIPSVVGNPSYQFTAVSSRNSQTPGVRNFHSIGEMLAQLPDLDAVSICTPPQLHYEAARLALTSGRNPLPLFMLSRFIRPGIRSMPTVWRRPRSCYGSMN